MTPPGPAGGLILLKEIPILDAVLEAYPADSGGGFTAYRNHTYRVVNFCVARSLCADDLAHLEKIAIAAAFHDFGEASAS